MQKQLKPNLFGGLNSYVSDSVQGMSPPESRPESRPLPKGDILNQQQFQDHINLEEKLERGIRNSQELHGHINQVAFQSEENLKAIRAKFDRLQGRFTQIEQDQAALGIETSQKIHFLQQKHLEQKKLEENIQSLVDRQNNLLKGYEVRMGQLQKLLSEKETQMIMTLAALNEAKAEIHRLKRM